MVEAYPTTHVAPAPVNGTLETETYITPQMTKSDPDSEPTPVTSTASAIYPTFVLPPTLPRPPFVDIGGVANFRCVGGYLSADGRHMVRPNLFYRCAHPMQITLEGLEQLTTTLGIKAVYDLRSAPEVARVAAAVTAAAANAHAEMTANAKASGNNTAPPPPPIIVPSLSHRFESLRHFTPVYTNEDSGPEALARRLSRYSSSPSPPSTSPSSNPASLLPYHYSDGFVSAYRDIALHGAPAYTVIFKHILSRPQDPFVFHCTAGKDRTGVLAALILRLANVPDDTIAWEYSLTEPGLGLWRTVFLDRMTAGPTGTRKMSREEAGRIVGSRAPDMRAWLHLVLDREFGGVDGYLRDHCGFTPREVEQIRRNLVVELSVEPRELLSGGGGGVVRPCPIVGWTPEEGVME